MPNPWDKWIKTDHSCILAILNVRGMAGRSPWHQDQCHTSCDVIESHNYSIDSVASGGGGAVIGGCGGGGVVVVVMMVLEGIEWEADRKRRTCWERWWEVGGRWKKERGEEWILAIFSSRVWYVHGGVKSSMWEKKQKAFAHKWNCTDVPQSRLKLRLLKSNSNFLINKWNDKKLALGKVLVKR